MKMDPQNIEGEIFFIEAGVGVGKTTLIKTTEKLLQESNKEMDKFKFVVEPIEEFTYFNGINPLKEMILGNITSSEFQIYISFVMIEHLRNNLEKGKIHIIERSPFSVVYIFSYFYYINKKMTSFLYETLRQKYCEIALNIIKDYKITFIYLDASLETILKHVKERNRDGEDWENSSYFEMIQTMHKNFFDSYIKAKGFNYIVINSDGNANDISKYFIDKCLCV